MTEAKSAPELVLLNAKRACSYEGKCSFFHLPFLISAVSHFPFPFLLSTIPGFTTIPIRSGGCGLSLSVYLRFLFLVSFNYTHVMAQVDVCQFLQVPLARKPGFTPISPILSVLVAGTPTLHVLQDLEELSHVSVVPYYCKPREFLHGFGFGAL